MPNKVKYGLKNVYYSVITLTNGVPSYATPVRVAGAVNLSMNAAGEKTEFNADDILYFVTTSNAGYEGTLEIALVPDSFRIDVLKEQVDSNGAIIENADTISNNFALMFEFNGDQHGTRHVLYNVNAARPNVEGSTKTKTIEPKTETLSITASPAVDTGDVKAKLKATDTGYTTFFTSVYLKNAPVNTVSSSTATFSKGTPSDVTIDATTTDGSNAVKNVMVDDANVSGVNLTIVGIDATIESTYLSTLSIGSHVVVVEFTKGNSVTVALTVTA